jgi:uncharacterized membrane protein YphA (DoxX/SURF4 family)
MATPTQSRSRLIAYWITTLLVAWEMAMGGIWDLLHTAYVRSVMDHLGYPGYFLIILGIWKLLGTAAMLVPRFPRLREWAYAGMFFTYSGAIASHLFAGDGPARWAGPAIFGLLLVVSWGLKPAAQPTDASAVLAPREAPRGPAANIGYWVLTGLLTLAIFSGGVGQITRNPQTVAGVVQLGYPAYLTSILGFWKLAGTLAILAPGFVRLKEWAYAGIFFVLTGAAISHAVCHDPAWHVAVTLTLAAFAVGSWALRPASRRVATTVAAPAVQSARPHPSYL